MDDLIQKPKLRVLFFASDPSDESRLNLGKELQSIRNRLKDNPEFEIKDHLATKHNDIMNEIMNYKPHIVHFSGHGTPEGELRFEDEVGNARSIPPDALATLFSLAKDSVKCVVVNTCYAEKQARAIAQYIPIVIGTKSEISDDAAISFSTGFYTALNPDLSTESLEKAFSLGNVAIQFSENVGDHLKPVIIYGSSNVRFAAEVDSAFSKIKEPRGHAVNTLISGLTLTGKKMGLSEQVAKNIIDERITRLYTYKSNLLEYENNLKEMLRDEFPLSESSLSSLSYLQTGLNLNDTDVKLIHGKILSDTKLDDAFSWYERGYNQNSLGDYDLSIQYLTKALERNIEYSAAYAVRGLSYSKKGELKTAIDDYTKAITINKNWEITSALSYVYFDRAFASMELGTVDATYLKSGVEDYLKVIEFNPEEPTAYYNVALGYEKLKDFREAVKYFIQALEKGYDNKASIFAWIVKCYSELGENKKRDEWLAKAKAENVV